MNLGTQYELIILPAVARPQIPDRLRSAGIGVELSEQPVPPKFRDAGTVYTCREGKGSAEILVMDEAALPPEHRSMVMILIFPGRGRLADWFAGTTDQELRKRINAHLYALKSEIAGPPNAGNRVDSD